MQWRSRMIGYGMGIACAAGAATGAVENADFSRFSPAALPLHWELRASSGATCRTVPGGIELGDPVETAVLVQDGIVLSPGRYRLSARVTAGQPGTEWRIYGEWTRNNDGQTVWEASPTEWQNSDGTEQVWQSTFEVTKDTVSAHLAIMVKPGGSIVVRDLRLETLEPATRRAAFGGDWELAPDSGWLDTPDHAIAFSVRQPEGAFCRGIPLAPGQRYRLQFEVKGAGAEDNLAEFVPFRVQAGWNGFSRSEEAPWDDTWNTNFQRKSFVFTVPAGSDGETELRIGAGATGAIFRRFTLDQEVETAPEQGMILFDTPCYRNTIFASQPVPEIAGRVTGLGFASDWRVELDTADGRKIPGTLHPAGDTVEFRIPATNLPDGMHTLRVFAGTVKLEAPLRKVAPAPVEVTIGSDRRFYRNGEPVFPVLYWEAPAGELGAYAAEQGFNLMVGGRPGSAAEALRQLDQAQNDGWSVMLNIGFPESADPATLRSWEHRLYGILTPEVLAHPALFGYYLADEPYWAGVPVKNLLVGYERLNRIDPYHPVWTNEAPRGTVDVLRIYGRATDVYGADIYPVPYPNGHSALEDKNMTAVGAYTRRMLDAVDGRKPVLMTLQGFSWHALAGTDPGIAYPTAAELRFMTFNAIVSGSTGVAYWGMNHVLTPSFLETLFAQTRELAMLRPWLTGGECVRDAAASDNPAIRVLTLRCGDKTMWIALNDSLTEQPAAFRVTTATATQVWVWNEARSLPVADGVWNDRFAPSAVHIYCDEAPPPTPAADASPFPEAIRRRLNAEYYDGAARWIWMAPVNGRDPEEVTLIREFELSVLPRQARLAIVADDRGELVVNDHDFGAIDGWTPLKEFDLAPYLRTGTNSIVVTARNQNGPGGVLADLTLTETDGKTEHLVSDAAWRTATGAPCREIAPYGSGAWGRKVETAKP